MDTITIAGKNYISVSSAAKMLGISNKTIYAMTYERGLRFLEVLGHKVVCKEDVEKLMRHPKTTEISR